MKTFTTSLALIALLFATSCASFERNAYVTIGIAVHTVDAAMNIWGDHVRSGKATEEQQVKVKAAYEKYQSAMHAAKTAMTLYLTSHDKTTLQNALDIASQGTAALMELLQTFLPPDKAAQVKGLK